MGETAMKLLKNLLRPKPAAPTPSEAGKVLSELACLNDRERVRARTRLMREQLGLPASPLLEPRCKR